MLQILISVVAFIVAISILVAVHEFGHFWVARQNGIRVLRFSIGFGRPLYRWYDKQGTEFVISAIPLGGYVSLLGEKNQEVPSAEQHLAFSYKSPWVRIAVLLAGPLFNLFFAIGAFWIIYLIGVSVYMPILGNVPANSAAAKAGLHKGQEIVSVENILTPSWESVGNILLTHIGEDKIVDINVRDSLLVSSINSTESSLNSAATSELNTPIQQKKLDLSGWDEGKGQGDVLEGLGLEPYDPIPAVAFKIVTNLPAEKVGFKAEDRILSIDDKPIESRMEAISAIQKSPGKMVTVEVLRGNQKIKLKVTPDSKQGEKGTVGFIGIEFPALKETPKALMHTEHYGPIKALSLAIKKTWSYSILTLKVMKKMVMGQLSARHVSGPITIAKYAGQTANLGFQQFLNFMALISISLGVLNLLPIPILDGGHILYCIAEIIHGKPLSTAVQNAGFWLGGLVLFCFMFLAFYNDFTMILQ